MAAITDRADIIDALQRILHADLSGTQAGHCLICVLQEIVESQMTDELLNSIAERLAQAIGDQSIATVAERTGGQVSKTTLKNALHATNEIKLSNLIALAQVLDVEAAWLVFGQGPMKATTPFIAPNGIDSIAPSDARFVHTLLQLAQGAETRCPRIEALLAQVEELQAQLDALRRDLTEAPDDDAV